MIAKIFSAKGKDSTRKYDCSLNFQMYLASIILAGTLPDFSKDASALSTSCSACSPHFNNKYKTSREQG